MPNWRGHAEFQPKRICELGDLRNQFFSKITQKLKEIEKVKNRIFRLPRSTRALLEPNFAPELIFIPRRACLSRVRGIPDRQRASWPVLRYSVQMEIRPVTRADLKLYSFIWRETLRIQSCAKLERACRVSAQMNL